MFVKSVLRVCVRTHVGVCGLVCFLLSISVLSHTVVLHYRSVQHAECKLLFFLYESFRVFLVVFFLRDMGNLTLQNGFGILNLGLLYTPDTNL